MLGKWQFQFYRIASKWMRTVCIVGNSCAVNSWTCLNQQHLGGLIDLCICHRELETWRNSLPTITAAAVKIDCKLGQAKQIERLIYAMIDNILRFNQQTLAEWQKQSPKSRWPGVGDHKTLYDQSILNDPKSQIDSGEISNFRPSSQFAFACWIQRSSHRLRRRSTRSKLLDRNYVLRTIKQKASSNAGSLKELSAISEGTWSWDWGWGCA